MIGVADERWGQRVAAGCRRERDRARSSTRTASRRRSHASSGRASTVTSRRSPSPLRGRSCAECCETRRVRPYERVRRFRVERDGAVATITLDVAGKAQPRLDDRARPALGASSPSSTATTRSRFVVLTGAGGAFTAGGDIAGFLERSPWEVSQLAKNVAAPERCSKPVDRAARGLRLRCRARARARVRLPARGGRHPARRSPRRRSG